MATGTATNVSLGPGWLYVAAIGTTEPTSASAALPSAWRDVGYTEEGSTFSYEYENEGIEVAEELDAIRYVTTGRAGTLAFNMAEATRRNLALALNAGAAAANDATAIEPTAAGSEVRVMAVWDSGDATAVAAGTSSRWLFRQCFQAGNIEIDRHKAPDKSLIPVEFRLEKPTGLQPFKVFPNSSFLI